MPSLFLVTLLNFSMQDYPKIDILKVLKLKSFKSKFKGDILISGILKPKGLK